jgi:protein-S-isoprenylcysteine O-methyltransferase Ste14
MNHHAPSPNRPRRPAQPLPAPNPRPRMLRIRNFAGNVLLAATYLGVLLPTSKYDWGSKAANVIWLGGAAIIGLMTLFRRPPTAVRIGAGEVITNFAALVTPALMRPAAPAHGVTALLGVGLELGGVMLSQLARIAMGRSFGMFPAHRGLVMTGPFRFVRHPVYLGWIVLGSGFAVYYPTGRNLTIMLITIPLVIWRIILEEDLLAQDPAYRVYSRRVRYALVPFIY